MKRLSLLWVLLVASGFAGASIALSNQAITAAVASESHGQDSVQKRGKERSVSAPRELSQSSEKQRLLPAGPANGVEVKQVKMLFLLMITQGPYPTPVY